MRNPGVLHIKTINGDWCDKDIVMLHASFQLLTDFVEEEISSDIADWEHDEKRKSVRTEIDDLYNWWKERIQKEEAGELDPIRDADQYNADNQMLIRLINIRGYLWT